MAATVVRLQNASATAQSAAAEAAWQPESVPEDDDLVLIHCVAAKDRRAFEVLYHHYARRLYGYVAKFIKQPELVEEVLDDIMLVIWQNAARFDRSSRLSTWIFGIAHHKALKALGRSSRQQTEPLPGVPLYRYYYLCSQQLGL